MLVGVMLALVRRAPTTLDADHPGKISTAVRAQGTFEMHTLNGGGVALAKPGRNSAQLGSTAAVTPPTPGLRAFFDGVLYYRASKRGWRSVGWIIKVGGQIHNRPTMLPPTESRGRCAGSPEPCDQRRVRQRLVVSDIYAKVRQRLGARR